MKRILILGGGFAGVECYSFEDHANEWRKQFNKLANNSV